MGLKHNQFSATTYFLGHSWSAQ